MDSGAYMIGALALLCAAISGAAYIYDYTGIASIFAAFACVFLFISLSISYDFGKTEAIVYACPECSAEYKTEYSFCPECGAAMVGNKNNGLEQAEKGVKDE